MSCNNNKTFQVSNLFNELQTEGLKRIARLNLGVKDSDSLTWGNIGGNIYDLSDLIELVEMLKMLASLTGTVAIFRLNNNTIARTIQNIPEGWSENLPDTTALDVLWMTQAVKQGGIYKVGTDGNVWGEPILLNYSNAVDAALQEEIDELRDRLNTSIQNLEYVSNLVNSMNLVTVNADGSISVTGRDGLVSVWLHQDLGNYLMLGNIYGDSENNYSSYFLINKTGLLQAHNALIHGTIYATDGWFAGELRAATGSFRGEITATSGRIGGWQIVDGVLKPENVPTTALIGKILASQVEFGSVLTDLRTLIAEDYNSKINTLRTNILSNIDLISTRFLLSNDSISSSVQEIREILNNHGLQLRTVSDKINLEKNARMTLYLLLESKILQNSDLLSLGVLEAILSYSNKFKDYITTELLESKLTLLSNLIAAKVSEVDYNENNRVIESRFAELAITPEQILSIVSEQITGITSNWTLTADSLQAQITEKGNLLSQLGITSDGIMMKGNTLAYYATGNVTDPIFACNSDGSGKIAKGTISWDTNGNVTLGRNVVISWNDILDKPEIDPDGTIELSIKDIQPVYLKNTSLPSKPISTTIISNEDVDQLWTTKVPTLDDNTKSIYKCDKITHSNDTITFTTVKEDTALTIAQRSKNRLDYLFQNGDHLGTTITNEYIYTGAFGTRDAYIMHIASATSNPKWELKTDGSGFLANNNISWDAEGTLTVEGTINAQNGKIAGWSINSDYLEAVYEDSFIKLHKNAMIEMGKVNENVSLRITPSSLLIASSEDGIDYPHTCFNSDGSGFIANENISWNTTGLLTLTGNINTTSGTIGGWEITNLYIQGSLYISNLNSVTGMYDAIKSTTKLYNNGCIEINSKYGYATAESNAQQSMVGITNNAFAGINEDGLYTSRESFTPESHYSTIRLYTNLIKVDGSGLLANNNINWDTRGNVTIKFTLSSGNTTYDITLDNSGIHYVDQNDDTNRGTLEWAALIDNVS